MNNKFAIMVFMLVVLCTSKGWAGTSGNGWAQRGGIPPEVKTKYVFCYAGNPKVVYFSQVVTVAPGAPGLDDIAYSHYIQKRYGLPAIDRMRCVPSNSGTDAAVEKQRYKEMSGKTMLVDNIKWEGK